MKKYMILFKEERQEQNEQETTIYDNIQNRPTRKELDEMIRQEQEMG